MIAAALLLLAACGNARADEWHTLRPAGLERTEVAAARVGNAIYVAGGFERAGGVDTAAVERYDIRRDRWTRVRAMPVALNHAAIATYRGDVYVVGGYKGSQRRRRPAALRPGAQPLDAGCARCRPLAAP